MIILPVGQADSEVRRWPWITLALVALNILIFLGTHLSERDLEVKIDAKGREVLDYLTAHPYLTPPQSLLTLLGPEDAELIQQEIQSIRAEARSESYLAAIPKDEQQQLDRLGGELHALVQERPSVRFGYVPADPRADRLISSMFMHGGFSHLAGNMLFLLLLGPFLEDVWGRLLYPAFYLVSGIVAALAHAATDQGSLIPLIGASGAIAGVMGAFLVRLGTSRIRFLCIPIVFLPTWRFSFHIPAFIVLPAWFLEQLAYAKWVPDAPVAWWAHVGGFSFGVLLALVVKAVRVEEKVIQPSIEKDISWEADPGLQRAIDARASGDFDRARRELSKVLAGRPNDVDAWRNLFDTAVAQGDGAEAARAAQRMLDLYRGMNETTLVSQSIDEAFKHARHYLSPRYLLAAAAERERQAMPEAAWDLYQILVERHVDDPMILKALARMAELRHQWGRPEEALRIVDFALAHPACDATWRKRLEPLRSGPANPGARLFVPPPPLVLPALGTKPAPPQKAPDPLRSTDTYERPLTAVPPPPKTLPAADDEEFTIERF
ncbi:MAG: rhomboid family intramembrane serine protease [Acidobacteria bacterium]|nr:rhomboid family intramembrane serine protease [Acidobacteriota bacterium]